MLRYVILLLASTMLLSDLRAPVTWQLEWDDEDNYEAARNRTLLTTTTLLSPVLGTVEPVATLHKLLVARMAAALSSPAEIEVFVERRLPVFVSVVGRLHHIAATLQLLHVCDKLTDTLHGDDHRKAHARLGNLLSVLMWGLHPLRVETYGWLSCMPYLIASNLCLVGRMV